MKTEFIIISLFAILSLHFVALSQHQPNVILFVSDALGYYGNNVIKTANLDALAANGVRFANAHCTSANFCIPYLYS